MLQDGNVGLPEGFAQEIHLGLLGPIPQPPAVAAQVDALRIVDPREYTVRLMLFKLLTRV